MKKLFLVLIASLLVFGCTQQADRQNAAETTPKQADYYNVELPSNASYIPFDKSTFNAAKAQGKIIFLEFKSDWCTTCRTLKPLIEKAFSKTNNSKVIGFEVHFNDGQTTADEKSLAREMGVFVQHTHIILNNKGEVAFRSNEVLNSTLVYDAITSVLEKNN